MEIFISKAALTVVRLEDGRRVNVHKGRAVPSSADPADVDRLLDEGFLEVIEVHQPEDDEPDEDLDDFDLEEEAVAVDDYPSYATQPRPDGWETFSDDEKRAYVYGPPGGSDDDVPPPAVDVAGILENTTAEVLAVVGSNAELAAQLLPAEQAAAKPRKGLLDGLEAVIAAAAEGTGSD